MTLAKNDIENAQRESAMDRAHSMCIDKIKELSEQNKKYEDVLVRIANGSFTGASHIAMGALGLI